MRQTQERRTTAATISWSAEDLEWLHHLDKLLRAYAHSQKFFARPFLCGFCAVEELQKMKNYSLDNRSPIIEADSIEHYGRRESVRIFGVEEELDEYVFANLINVAEKAVVTISANDVSTCHRLPDGSKGPKPLIDKFARRDTKHQLMKHKRNLKETSIYVNDDLTPLGAKINRDLRIKDNDRGFVTAIEKIIVFMRDNQELVFDNLHKLKKWVIELFSNDCNGLKKYSL